MLICDESDHVRIAMAFCITTSAFFLEYGIIGSETGQKGTHYCMNERWLFHSAYRSRRHSRKHAFVYPRSEPRTANHKVIAGLTLPTPSSPST